MSNLKMSKKLKKQFEKETKSNWLDDDDRLNYEYVKWLERRLEAGQHETQVMRKNEAIMVAIIVLLKHYPSDFTNEFTFDELSDIAEKTDNEELLSQKVEKILREALYA